MERHWGLVGGQLSSRSVRPCHQRSASLGSGAVCFSNANGQTSCDKCEFGKLVVTVNGFEGIVWKPLELCYFGLTSVSCRLYQSGLCRYE
eukprot:723306-Amphidinium_carterae.1